MHYAFCIKIDFALNYRTKSEKQLRGSTRIAHRKCAALKPLTVVSRFAHHKHSEVVFTVGFFIGLSAADPTLFKRNYRATVLINALT